MTAGKQAHGSAHTKKSDERSTMTRMHSSTKRPRAPIACFRCHHKKVRCDGLHPNCTRCLSTGVLCAYPSSRRSRNTQPTNVDPFIDNLSQLEARIRRIENDLVSQRALIESANPSASASASESVTLHGGQVDSSTSSSSSSTAAFSMSSPQISTPTVAADLTKQMVKIEQEVQESRAILAQLRLRGEQRIARGKRAAASSSTCSSSASSSSTSAGMSLPKPRTENSTSTSAFPKNDGHQPYLKHRKISSSVSVRYSPSLSLYLHPPSPLTTAAITSSSSSSSSHGPGPYHPSSQQHQQSTHSGQPPPPPPPPLQLMPVNNNPSPSSHAYDWQCNSVLYNRLPMDTSNASTPFDTTEASTSMGDWTMLDPWTHNNQSNHYSMETSPAASTPLQNNMMGPMVDIQQPMPSSSTSTSQATAMPTLQPSSSSTSSHSTSSAATSSLTPFYCDMPSFMIDDIVSPSPMPSTCINSSNSSVWYC